MPELNLELLGGFEARTADGPAISFPTKKTKALLAYLAAHQGKSHSRSNLANLLWGDSPDEQARASLRQTLTYLRKALAPTGLDHLVTQDDLVSVNPATLRVDVAIVERLAAQGNPDGLELVGELYRGDFLQGFDLPEEDFNDWLRTERVRLRGLVTGALKTLLAHCEANGQVARGICAANRLLEIDPLQEHAHRALMRLHLCQGERALALRQYEICHRTLMREVDSEPDDETKHVRDQARAAKSSHGDGANAHRPEPPPENPHAGADLPAIRDSWRPKRPGRMRLTIALAATAAIIYAVFQSVWIYQGSTPEMPPYARGPTAEPTLAVLPFDNMSGNPELDSIADGITGDIVGGLSRWPGFLTIAGGSSFTGEDGLPKGQEAAEGRKVDYVLKGNVRRLGDRVQIAAQLIDTQSGRQIWAEPINQENSDVFAAIDGVTERIVEYLTGDDGRMRQAAYRDKWGRDSAGLEEYGYLVRGQQFHDRLTRPGTIQAFKVWQEGLDRFPESGLLRIKLGFSHLQLARFGWSNNPGNHLERAAELAGEGLAGENLGPFGKWHGRRLTAFLNVRQRNFNEAVADIETALALAPYDADTLASSCQVYLYAGYPETCLKNVTEGLRRNPDAPFWYYRYAGWAHYAMGQPEKAVDRLRAIGGFELDKNRILAASYAELGLLDDARRVAAEILDHYPGMSLETLGKLLPYADEAHFERELAALRKAGIPEKPPRGATK